MSLRPRLSLRAGRARARRLGAAAPPTRPGLDLARRIELASVLIVAFATLAGVWYSNAQVRQVRDELALAQEGQITDRYTAAVDQLGDDAIDVRLGGLYALQRLMQDSPRDHPTIVNVLAAYLRTHAHTPSKKGADVPADVAAALTILATRQTDRDRGVGIDLDASYLRGVDLSSPTVLPNGAPRNDGALQGPARLAGADLRGVDLREADLQGGDLEEVTMAFADLAHAKFTGTDLRRADLQSANLEGALFEGTDLTHTLLFNADLAGAGFSGANLTHADLTKADLTGVDIYQTDLREAILTDANLAGANLSEARLTVRQLTSAHITSETILPPHLRKNPAIRARIAEIEETATAR